MRSWLQRLASLLVVLAMVGTPSVVAACALLCLPGAGHHAAAADSTSAPAAASVDAHADCHGSQGALPAPEPDATSTAAIGEPGPDAGVLGASSEHTCCPDTLGLPALSSASGRSMADHLPLVAVSWAHHRAGEGLLLPRALTRSLDFCPRPSSASAPLVLRI